MTTAALERNAGVIGTALAGLEALFDGQAPPPGDLPAISTALDDMSRLIRDNLTGDSQREAYRRLGCLRKQLSDAQPGQAPATGPQQACARPGLNGSAGARPCLRSSSGWLSCQSCSRA